MEPNVLIPEPVPFKINTTYLSVHSEERDSLQVLYEVQKLTESSKQEILNGNYTDLDLSWTQIKLVFPLFAEVNHRMVNFFEWEYDNFQIKNDHFDLDKVADNAYMFNYWAQNNIHPNPGFYQVLNSPLLQRNGKRYDPNNNYNLKHYLVNGYDSHIEFIASENYTFEVLDLEY